MLVAEELKALRAAKNMTQEEFANWLGIPYTTYRKYEQGVRKPMEFVIQAIRDKCKEKGE